MGKFFFLLVGMFLYASELVVVNSISQTLSRVNLQDGSVDNGFATLGQTGGSAPNIVAIKDHYAYVVITYENAVQKIDLETKQVRSYIFLEDSSSPNEIIIHGNDAYVTGNETSKVYQIDLLTDEVINTFEVGLSPQGMTIHENKLYVANTGFKFSDYSYEPGTITKINLLENSVEATISVSLNPCSMEVVNDKIHVVCSGDFMSIFGKVSVYDPSIDQIVDTIDIGGSPGSIEYAMNGKVYLGNTWPAGVYQYDAESFVVDIIPENGIFDGGNTLMVHDNYLYTVDALDYQQNSIIRKYEINTQQLISSYEVGIGATDVKFYDENSYSGSNLIQVQDVTISNYPNPFNPRTILSFDSNQTISSPVFQIYNSRGQKVFQKEVKSNQIVWDGKLKNGKSAGSGVFYYRLIGDNFSSEAKSMVLLK